jgi:uncharacterized membrane protein SpoIIM required for sporulation
MTDPEPGPARLHVLYRDEWARWKASYRPCFKAAARALGSGFVLGFAVFLIWPAQEKRALLLLVKALKDIPLGAPPLVLALSIFYHNAWASLIAVAAGAVPFLCLPILDPFVNGAALGLLASVSKHQGFNVPLLFLKSVAPHGLFELPAVLYAASAGIHLSVTLGKVLRAKLRKRKADGTAEAPPRSDSGTPSGVELTGGPAEAGPGDIPSLADELVSVARSFVLVVLPLLLIAAFIEAFVTPVLR